MWSYVNPASVTAGFVAMLVGYTSAAAIVYQAAIAGGAGPDQVASWMWAVGIGMGVATLGLSLFYRQPIVVAWSTPGAALLVTSLPGVPMDQAVGAFLVCSALITLVGITGWFDKLMALIPKSLAAALLAGVLVRFALELFPAFAENGWLVGAMAVVYLIGKWRGSVYAVPLSFAAGIGVAFAQGGVDFSSVDWQLITPVWVMPAFDLSVIIGVGLPLFVVTMASQNLPGVAVLRAHNVPTPASPLIAGSGVTGLVLAPFGGFAFNLAAITAALCMGKDANPDPKRPHVAALWDGLFVTVAGVFGAMVAGLLAGVPHALVAAIAALALLGTIANSLTTALAEPGEREAALLTFVIAASDGVFLTIGAPFWGVIAGVVVYQVMKRKR